jgi:WD40 repeat protein
MADIFISYKREERTQVERLATALSGLGLSVWFDASLSAGESFSDEIDREVRAARIVLVCWSPAATGSQWVKAEAQVGFGKGNLVSTLVAGPDGFEPPVPYNSQHLEDLRGWTATPSHRNPAWRSILRRVGALSGRSDISDWGALAADASAADVERWFARYGAQSPLAIEAESLLRERRAESAARTEAEAAVRERMARLMAEREAAEAEARALHTQAEADRRTAEADTRAARAERSASISRRTMWVGVGTVGLGAAAAGVWAWRGLDGPDPHLRPLFPVAEVTEAGHAAGIRDIRHEVRRGWSSGGATALSLDPNGRRFVVASGYNNAHIFGTSTDEQSRITLQHPSNVTLAAFHPTSLNVATASVATVYLWNPEGERVATLSGHTDHVDTLVHDDLGVYILTAAAGIQASDRHDSARVWNAENGELIGTFTQPGGVSCADFAPSTKGLATGSQDGYVYLRDFYSFAVRFALETNHVSVLSVSYHPDGERLISVTPVNVRLWHAASGTLLADLEGGGSIHDGGFSPNGEHIACVSVSHTTGIPSRIRIWDVTPLGAVNRRDIEGDYRTIAFTADSKAIVAGREDGAICLHAANTGALLATLRGHSGIASVAVDPHNLLLASYSEHDAVAHVWKMEGPQYFLEPYTPPTPALPHRDTPSH